MIRDTTRMTYDCFSFFNELDVLEIRLNTLNEVVDKFVLVEAPWTHTGHPKPLYFQENKERFKPFLDKIIHIIASDPPTSPSATDRENAWIRENWQRNEIVKGLNNAKPDDILIIADLDEIPMPNVIISHIPTIMHKNSILNLNLRCYAFFLNNRCVSSPFWKAGPQLLTYARFSSIETYKDTVFSELCPRCANPLPSATLIRFSPQKEDIDDAGWHLSSLGGAKAVQKKIQSFAHTEFTGISDDLDAIHKTILSGKGFFGFGDHYIPEPLENNLPKFIVNNEARYSDLILETDIHTWKRSKWKRNWFRFIKKAHSHLIEISITLIPKPLHNSMRKIRNIIGA